jgi:adenylate cyclase
LGEQRLPFDVVFILNQFFAEMSAALKETNGHYAQFNGDGLMALYGLEGELKTACREALQGAKAMSERLALLNKRLERELDEPLRVGIGIHCGDAVVGTMGPPGSPILSAIGDTINIGARLEAKTKRFGCTLVISRELSDRAGLSVTGLTQHEVSVRGRQQPLAVLAVDQPSELYFPWLAS